MAPPEAARKSSRYDCTLKKIYFYQQSLCNTLSKFNAFVNTKYVDKVVAQKLKWPASRLFTQASIQTQMKENIKAPRHWPLCGEFTGTGDFPAQRASYAENVSIWWRHHEKRSLKTKTIQVCWRQRRLSLWRPPLSLVKIIKAVIMIILQFC